MQILVADDDMVVRTLLSNMLEQWQLKVVLATDGKEAWDILSGANAPRLLLVDWMMPRMDGFELCSKVRAGKHGEDTYILLMTASHNKEDIMRVLVAGADDYLLKPFDPIDLQIHIRTAMRIMRLRDELRQARRLTAVA